MKNKNKKVILVGKGGAGKDFLAQHLIKSNYRKDISYTTRPPRDNEKNGVDYYFISEKEFENKINEDVFYEFTSFNGWLYGTSLKSWKTSDLFIMTPEGVSKITPKDLEKCLIVYIDIPEEIRKYRLEKRTSSPDSILRRLEADKKDFKYFEDASKYHLLISNPYYSLESVEKCISSTRLLSNTTILQKACSFFINILKTLKTN